jgi:hypothetical protein
MKIITTITAAMLLFSFHSQAALVESDWLDAGDSRATLDLESGKKWLDLTETMGMSIGQVENLLNTTYQGFTLATESQIQALLISSFSEHYFQDESHFDDEAARGHRGGNIYDIAGGNSSTAHQKVSDYLGLSIIEALPWGRRTETIYSMGLYKTGDIISNGSDGVFNLGIRKAYNHPQSKYTTYIHYDNEKNYYQNSDTLIGSDYSNVHYGVWLVEGVNDVSSPQKSFLLLLAMIGVTFTRRQRT